MLLQDLKKLELLINDFEAPVCWSKYTTENIQLFKRGIKAVL